jgi:hypothetical protein
MILGSFGGGREQGPLRTAAALIQGRGSDSELALRYAVTAGGMMEVIDFRGEKFFYRR